MMDNRDSNQTLSLLLDGLQVSPDCFGFFDSESRLMYCNSIFGEVFAVEPNKAIGETLELLMTNLWKSDKGMHVDTNCIDQYIDKLHGLIETKKVNQFEIEIGDGRFFKMSRITLDDGGLLLLGVDITDNKIIQKELGIAYREIEKMANTDALTGVGNRRSFDTFVKNEFSRSRRYNQNLAICILDIDYFKKINDKYGHESGDVVLRGFSQVCLMELRETDKFFRVGGEEFVIVSPMSGIDESRVLSERVRQSIEASEFPIETLNLSINITCSIGVSILREDDNSSDCVTSRADEALYTAKEKGRNLVVLTR